MFCVNPWKKFYINASVSEDCDYEVDNGKVSENGAYDTDGGNGDVFSWTWEECAQLQQLWRAQLSSWHVKLKLKTLDISRKVSIGTWQAWDTVAD